ncbi:MAG: Holliday junction branch migration protein RuvA [Bacteroidales bacterium]|nr:Holliday junction branch migration protein RuvA [Candidatus Cryptobacteroides aphodequi]
MIDYIKGEIAELTPTRVVVETAGIGYSIEISLQTYAALENCKQAKVYIYHHIQSSSDVELFYGFATQDERALFTQIIGVSGVGVNTARMILSTFSADEFRNAVVAEDVNLIKSVKGIGLKGAQRIVLELKDKIVKGSDTPSQEIFSAAAQRNVVAEEAAAALLMLGFSKPNIQKAIQTILKRTPTAKVEEIIKSALQML